MIKCEYIIHHGPHLFISLSIIMRSYYRTPIDAGETGGYCGGNGGVSKLPSKTVIQILDRVKMLLIGVPSLIDIEISSR